jgi:TM2 domain-containing membrane protein YozV
MQDKQMNLAKKAALLNALLFPGWGEIYLKKYIRGIIFISAVMAGMISILLSIIQATVIILKTAPFKKGTVTLIAVVQLAIDAIKSLDLSYLFLIFLSLIVLWIASIFDAYHLGKQEMARTPAAPAVATDIVPPEQST